MYAMQLAKIPKRCMMRYPCGCIRARRCAIWKAGEIDVERRARNGVEIQGRKRIDGTQTFRDDTLFLGSLLSSCEVVSRKLNSTGRRNKPLVTFPAPVSAFSTDLMTPTATVCLISRTAKRPRGG